MADTTHIEWTDATWNIITGCDIGCAADGSPWPNTRSGILVYNTPGTVVTGNRLCHNHRSGITIDGSRLPLSSPSWPQFGALAGQGHACHTEVSANTITGNGLRGVLIFEGHDNLVKGNAITGNPVGVDMIRLKHDRAATLTTARNAVTGNRFTANTLAAIRLKWTEATAIAGNSYEGNRRRIIRHHDEDTSMGK